MMHVQEDQGEPMEDQDNSYLGLPWVLPDLPEHASSRVRRSYGSAEKNKS